MTKTKLIASGCLMMLLVLFQSCATIMKGTNSNVNIDSDPQGASVYIDGNNSGKTPMKMKLESKRSHNIEFKKEGYENKTINLTNNVSGGYVVLDILFGLLPVIIDASTGAWYDLDPINAKVILENKK